MGVNTTISFLSILLILQGIVKYSSIPCDFFYFFTSNRNGKRQKCGEPRTVCANDKSFLRSFDYWPSPFFHYPNAFSIISSSQSIVNCDRSELSSFSPPKKNSWGCA